MPYPPKSRLNLQTNRELLYIYVFYISVIPGITSISTANETKVVITQGYQDLIMIVNSNFLFNIGRYDRYG